MRSCHRRPNQRAVAPNSGPTLLKLFDLGASRRTWSEVGADFFSGVRLTPARLSWSQLSGVGVNLESAFGTGANLESTSASCRKLVESTWSQPPKVGVNLESALKKLESALSPLRNAPTKAHIRKHTPLDAQPTYTWSSQLAAGTGRGPPSHLPPDLLACLDFTAVLALQHGGGPCEWLIIITATR